MMIKRIKELFGWVQKPDAEWYLNYLHRWQAPDKKMDISKQSFVVFDTETSGLDLNLDHVISIGAIRVRGGEMVVSDSFSVHIIQQLQHSTEAIRIHGLIKTEARGVEKQIAMSRFFDFVGSDILVGHHVGFDFNMVNKASRESGGGALLNKLLDTAYLAKRLDSPSDPFGLDGKDFSLDKLSLRFNVMPKARHTADGDAFITALVFLKLLDRLAKKGVRKVGDLLQ